jgi:DNA-binding response OmpR family regulator
MSVPTPSFHILIVDDDEGVGQVVSSVLQREGYTTRVVTNGFECIDIVREGGIDLLLLDVTMPQMDGFQVCEALAVRDPTRSLPIILLTGRTDLETRVSGMHHGVTEFLTKPVNRHELIARVRAQLHILELSRQLETIDRNLQQRQPSSKGDRS